MRWALNGSMDCICCLKIQFPIKACSGVMMHFLKISEPGRSQCCQLRPQETIRAPKQVQICSNGLTSINQMILLLYIESFTRCDKFKWTYFSHLEYCCVWEYGIDCMTRTGSFDVLMLAAQNIFITV